MEHTLPLLYESLPQEVVDLLAKEGDMTVPYYHAGGEWRVAVEIIGEHTYRLAAAGGVDYFEPLRQAPFIDLRKLTVEEVVLLVRRMAAQPTAVIATAGWAEGEPVEVLVEHFLFVLPTGTVNLQTGDLD